jgi:hypothetical protein
MKAKLLPLKKTQNKATRLIYKRFRDRFPGLPERIDQVVYQYLPGAIRLRVIDSAFRNLSYLQREEAIADVVATLPDEIRRSILLTLLMTPEEAAGDLNGMELEFDNPTGEHL